MKFCNFHSKPRFVIQRYSQILVSPPDIQHTTNRHGILFQYRRLVELADFLTSDKILRTQRQLIIFPVCKPKNTLVPPLLILINKCIFSLHEMITMPLHDRNNLLNKKPLDTLTFHSRMHMLIYKLLILFINGKENKIFFIFPIKVHKVYKLFIYHLHIIQRQSVTREIPVLNLYIRLLSAPSLLAKDTHLYFLPPIA